MNERKDEKPIIISKNERVITVSREEDVYRSFSPQARSNSTPVAYFEDNDDEQHRCISIKRYQNIEFEPNPHNSENQIIFDNQIFHHSKRSSHEKITPALKSEDEIKYMQELENINSNDYFKNNGHYSTIVSSISSTLDKLQNVVSYSYSPLEFIWNCFYLNESVHSEFDITIFKFPKKDTEFAIEVRRIQGDRKIILTIKNLLKKYLDSPSSSNGPILINTYDDDDFLFRNTLSNDNNLPVSVSSESNVLKAPGSPTSPTTSFSQLSVSTDKSIISSERSIEEIFQEIVKQYNNCNKRHSEEYLRITQEACDLYSIVHPMKSTAVSTNAISLETNRQLISWIVKMIVDTETINDWPCQHAAWLLAYLTTYSSLYCEVILELSPEFPEIMFRLAVKGNHTTNLFRKKCIKLIYNFLQYKKASVEKYIKSEAIDAWLDQDFTKSVLTIG